MKKLVLPHDVLADIGAIVDETGTGCETGVRLFGVPVPHVAACASYAAASWPVVLQDRYVVLAVAGPGPDATHESVHYAADADYSSGIWQALQTALPSIAWLGELHVHPQGMPWLSAGDRRTMRGLLTSTTPDAVCPAEFIAGVMQRRKHAVEIYPVYFNRTMSHGSPMKVECIRQGDDLLRRARELAAKDCRQAPHGGERPDDLRDGPAIRQGWAAKVVNTLMRRTTHGK